MSEHNPTQEADKPASGSDRVMSTVRSAQQKSAPETPVLPNRKASIIRIFIASVACILLSTAVIKLISVAQDTRFLVASNHLFPSLSNRTVTFLGALLELSVASALFRSRSLRLRLTLVAWISTMFLAYRVGLWIFEYEGPCHCLGSAVEWTGMDEVAMEWALRALLAWMLLGSYGLLAATRKRPSDPKTGTNAGV